MNSIGHPAHSAQHNLQLHQLPLTSLAADEASKRERKRDLLVLILRFLYDCGFTTSYSVLCHESALSLTQIDAADNIDLLTIVQEYTDYYHGRFGRPPKLTRYSDESVAGPNLQGPAAEQVVSLHPPAGLPLILKTHVQTSEPSPSNTVRKGSENYTTRRTATREPVTQEELVSALASTPNPEASLTTLFSFYRPKPSSKRRSEKLELSDMQEAALYAVVGCSGVGWSVRLINPGTRQFLCTRFGIDKELLHLFFKNRAQKKRQRSGSAHNGLPPLPPPATSCGTDDTSIYEMAPLQVS